MITLVLFLILTLPACSIQFPPQTTGAHDQDTLAFNFRTPPQQYGIRCWWWWLNGNVTREAITRDLEEMKAKGFSGACIVDAGGQNQQGNGDVPEGPMFGSAAWRALYLHAVKESGRLGLVLSLGIQSGWNLGGPDITPEEATKHLTWSEITVKGPSDLNLGQTLPLPPIRDNFYRDIVAVAFPKKNIAPTRPPIADLSLKAAFVEGNRSGYFTEKLLEDAPASAGEEDALLKDVVVLSKKPDSTGRIRWQVPAGEWTIMRFGYTTSDAHVSTSSGKWQGRVIDYMNPKYFNRYWETHVEPLLNAIGPMAGKTLRYLQTDSWELGGINWSDRFSEEFQSRRGYAPQAYLPVIAGRIIQSREVSNAFLADFRKTIGDCIAENHYKVFAERARKYGMGIQPESAGPHTAPIDGLKNYGYSEMMMSEFWSPSPHRSRQEDRFFVKQASSAAQIYNKRLVGAEAFTTIGRHWNDVPWATMKPPFDREVCSGLNLVFLHTFTCSPKEMGKPGQEYFAGTHINPNITWWNESGAVFDYFKRCQYLMQQGNIVTDVLYYYGDHVPNIGHLKAADPAGVLPGYDYDLINEDRLMTLSVRNGQVMLPHSIAYKVLVLPNTGTLSLAALNKIRDLVKDGATVVGTKPSRMLSLSGLPNSAETFSTLTNELWGQTPGAAGEKQIGKGRVIWGRGVREVLLQQGVQPDLEAQGISKEVYDYIHRRLNGTEVYFISNQDQAAMSGDFSFRITGKQPELWNAVTGEVKDAKAFHQEGGRTIVPLQLEPYGSVFVVFRKTITMNSKGPEKDNNINYQMMKQIFGPWKVTFDTTQGVPAALEFPALVSWTTRTEKDLRYYSGKAGYATTFDFPDLAKGERYVITLGNVQDVGIARVTLNGQALGITWTPLFRIEVTTALREKGNKLVVEVINSWRNRLVGDRELPAEKRFTKTNITIKPEWQLLDAGLLGPVEVSKIVP
ncbi:glycoside hydrolase [Fulvivirgaceae bacterium PWU4]|uniref:Glycoside hydrolase n=1 Tax=Chryseosolibacter histidini TaxID=2782349 RepID=A0AAP2DK13_9BACT|nr:glycosyl hydrolase [Chryseosolibacter histidini]MBT1695279.1 glycoside hydrolase [Chryseosolibacter histidini]